VHAPDVSKFCFKQLFDRVVSAPSSIGAVRVNGTVTSDRRETRPLKPGLAVQIVAPGDGRKIFFCWLLYTHRAVTVGRVTVLLRLSMREFPGLFDFAFPRAR
jgi:hypothetical protein